MRAWLDIDPWSEIFATLRGNRLRAALTALGVFWGVFMLVGMLGFGNGLKVGVLGNMRGWASNAIVVWGGRATKPYKGFQPGRRVRFDRQDAVALAGVPELEHVCPRSFVGGHWRGGVEVSAGGRAGNFPMSGDVPEIRAVQPVEILEGRFINELDLEQERKVAVIGVAARDELFGAGAPAIGEHVDAGGFYFQVVGVFQALARGERVERANRHIYVPLSTLRSTLRHDGKIDWLGITVRPGLSSAEVEAKVKALLASRHDVAPDDPDAVGSYNLEEEFRQMSNLFIGIGFLVWFAGVMTLVAGVIGVSNIMLISVRERTREIGVRRAIGATPSAIVGMVVRESMLLTSVPGCLGFSAAVIMLEVAGLFVPPDARFFSPPHLELAAALSATMILVVLGGMAGMLPARMAVRMRPAEALRSE